MYINVIPMKSIEHSSVINDENDPHTKLASELLRAVEFYSGINGIFDTLKHPTNRHLRTQWQHYCFSRIAEVPDTLIPVPLFRKDTELYEQLKISV